MIVTLTIDDDPLRGPLFEIVSETQSHLEDLGFEAKWMERRNYRASKPVLRHLEQNLFRETPTVIASAAEETVSFPRKPFGFARGSEPVELRESIVPRSPLKACGDDSMEIATPVLQTRNDEENLSIQIFEATGLTGEVEMIARQIKRFVRTHDYQFSDIAVLFRRADPYLPVVQSVFRRFRIPFELHERLRLKSMPFVRTLASFFHILLEGWNRKDLLNFLKSSYVDRDHEQIAALELEALRKGIFRDRTYWLRSFPDVKVLSEIAQFEDRFRTLQSADEFVNLTKELMGHFKMFRFPDRFDEKARLDRESARRIFLFLLEINN